MTHQMSELENLVITLATLNDQRLNEIKGIMDTNINLSSKMHIYLKDKKLFPTPNCLNLFLKKINSFKRCNVSPVFEFMNLIEEFKYNQYMKDFVNEAIREYHIQKRREIRGDGNCYYRSVMFNYFELIVEKDLIIPFCNFMEILITDKYFTIYSLKKIPMAVAIVKKIISVFKFILQQFRDKEGKLNALFLFFIFDSEFDISSCRFLRIMDYHILSQNLDLDAYGLPLRFMITTEDSLITKHLRDSILKDGTEGRDVTSILSALFLGIQIATILIDSSEPQNKLYMQVNEAESEKLMFPLKEKELLALKDKKMYILLKPGHYDVIYEANNSNREFIQILNSQSRKYLFIYKWVEENLNGQNPFYSEISTEVYQGNNSPTKNQVDESYPTITPYEGINSNKNVFGPSSKIESKIEENEKSKNHQLNKDLKSSIFNGQEKVLIPCQNIQKNKLKFQEELIQNNLKHFQENIKFEDITYLQCTICGKKEDNSYWVKVLEDISFKIILDEIVQKKNKSNDKISILNPQNVENIEESKEVEMINIMHRCKEPQVPKNDFINQLERSILTISPSKKFGIPQVIICGLCCREIDASKICDNIGKNAYDLLSKNVEEIQKRKYAQFHDHEIKEKEELVKEFTLSNRNFPWIYDLYEDRFKCHLEKCPLKVKKNEFINQLGQENLNKLEASIKEELTKHGKRGPYYFHCCQIEYKDTLKYGISELVEFSKINKSQIQCIKCNRELQLENLKKMQCEEKDIKLIFQNAGLKLPLPQVQVKCLQNKFVSEEEFIKSIYDLNVKFVNDYKYIRKNELVCPFCRSSHSINLYKYEYELAIITKIIQGLKENAKASSVKVINVKKSNSKIFPDDGKKVLFHGHEVVMPLKEFETKLMEEFNKFSKAAGKMECTCAICFDLIPDSEIQKCFTLFKGNQKPIKNEKFKFHEHILFTSKDDFKKKLKEHLLLTTKFSVGTFEYFCMECTNRLYELYLKEIFDPKELLDIKDEIKKQKANSQQFKNEENKNLLHPDKSNDKFNHIINKTEIKKGIQGEDKKEISKFFPQNEIIKGNENVGNKNKEEKKKSQLIDNVNKVKQELLLNPKTNEKVQEPNKFQPTKANLPKEANPPTINVKEKPNDANKLPQPPHNSSKPIIPQVPPATGKGKEEEKFNKNLVNPQNLIKVENAKVIGKPKGDVKNTNYHHGINNTEKEAKIIKNQNNVNFNQIGYNKDYQNKNPKKHK